MQIQITLMQIINKVFGFDCARNNWKSQCLPGERCSETKGAVIGYALCAAAGRAPVGGGSSAAPRVRSGGGSRYDASSVTCDRPFGAAVGRVSWVYQLGA